MALALVWWNSLDHRSPAPNRRVQGDSETETGAGKAVEAAALAQMESIAEGLRRYRTEFGDGVRWPMALDDLKQVQVLAADFGLTGALSGRPVRYAPDIPAGVDSARWAICSDVRWGNQSMPSDRGRYRPSVYAPVLAAVILGDGRVRLLAANEMDGVGGLVFDRPGAR